MSLGVLLPGAFPACSDPTGKMSRHGQCWHHSEPTDMAGYIPTAPLGSASGQRRMLWHLCCRASPEVWWSKLPEKSPPLGLALLASSSAASTASLLHPPRSQGWAPPGRRPADQKGPRLYQAPGDSSRLIVSVSPGLSPFF